MTTSKTVAGKVAHDGAILFASKTGAVDDFTVTRPTDGQPITGRYIINYPAKFTAVVAVVVTQVPNFTFGDTRDNAVVVKFDNSTADIITGRSDGRLENRPFSFIVTGD